ncbi:hypothetical protein BC826DRAFT_982409 [Russula brevipes]|nr:hypothetical protein BC826DRAFT_982409 [Russula brevipes]
MTFPEASYYLGIDVGTGSARAALVKSDGTVLASASQDTKTWRDPIDHRIFEQSTADVWKSICNAVKEVIARSNVPPKHVKGIGFDATCSLAVSSWEGEPITVTRGTQLGELGERNIILWADHRAEKEADVINATGSSVLDYVGGVISVLHVRSRERLGSRIHVADRARHVRAERVFRVGDGRPDCREPVGDGLTVSAAAELGLEPGTPVGSGVIDAYAGWLGTIAARHEEEGGLSPSVSLHESGHRLAAVAGTSTCHLVQLIDFIVSTHPAYQELKDLARDQNKTIHDILRETLEAIRQRESAESWTDVIAHVHFYPDLHGNRSPIADPRMRGSIVGLSLVSSPRDSSLHDLARKYALALEAIALQTRHIVDELNDAGHSIHALYLSGSQAQNSALMRLLANACNMPVVLPSSHAASVVLGAAMLGRFATMRDPADPATALWDIMQEMTPPGTVVQPAAGEREKRLLDVKYRIFLESIEIQRRWRSEIDAVAK